MIRKPEDVISGKVWKCSVYRERVWGNKMVFKHVEKKMFQRKRKNCFLCDRAEEARVSGPDCRKHIHTGYKNKTLIRNPEIKWSTGFITTRALEAPLLGTFKTDISANICESCQKCNWSFLKVGVSDVLRSLWVPFPMIQSSVTSLKTQCGTSSFVAKAEKGN